ncbi:hypothetical protein VI08_00410 [Luteibacter yeojuensis]|uniref:Uncharacterized protein n=2 Tax=Luteibacter yeojuensis TaxID=345309 RepID=A0A0F3L4N0_9GAMM|nr:hypothetical protein VI08_00410 [Luteibacter yeojuensis]
MMCGLAVWAFVSPAFARDQPRTYVAASGVTTVEATVGGAHVVVRITAHALDGPGAARLAQMPARACTGSRAPCSLVDDIDIRVQGERIWVPKGAYLGLADVTSATVSGAGATSSLTLNGGDASEAYIATLDFDRARVTGRSIAPATEPGKPLEKTTYRVVTTGD